MVLESVKDVVELLVAVATIIRFLVWIFEAIKEKNSLASTPTSLPVLRLVGG